MSIIEHILLFSLLFIVYAFWGKYMVKGNERYWQAAIVPVLLFVFITGSRYGWGNDYFWYKYQFEYAFRFDHRGKAPVFEWLNMFLNLIGFNYVSAFMVYGFIFIICAFIFIRSFGAQSMYMYCFLVPATLYTSTYTIRQGVGTAFIFLALTFLQNRKWVYMCIAAIIAYYIHSATIITLVILLGSFFVLKSPIHYAISIPLCFIITFIYDSNHTAFLADFIEKYVTLDGPTTFQSYLDKSDRWFGEGAIDNEFTNPFFSRFTGFIFNVSIFYLGYQALKIRNDLKMVYVFNVVVVSYIIFNAVIPFGILNRMTNTLQMFYFVPVGYIFYVYFTDCRQAENQDAFRLKKHFLIGMIYISAYIVKSWYKFILLNPKADFFWYHFEDAVNPKNYLY